MQKAAANDAEPLRERLVSIIAQIQGEAKVSTVRAAVADAAAGSAAGLPTADNRDWPQFRGPRQDAICTETGLLTDWPEDGPPLLWKLEGLGKGFSTISIVGGRFYTMGDRKAADGTESQFALAYDLATRRELWAARVGPPHQDGPRCTPTVVADQVYVLGTEGDLVCLDAATGKSRLAQEPGRRFRRPDDVDVEVQRVAAGRRRAADLHARRPEASLVALHKDTGETIWKCAVPKLGDSGKDGAGYASAVVAEIAGVRQYVQLLGRGAIGVEAATGRFLWGYNRIANAVANIPSPVVRGDYVFTTTSYKTGAALLHIQPQTATNSGPRRSTSCRPRISRTTTAAWCWWATTCTAATVRTKAIRCA